jgi:hypothetical protein
MSKEIYVKQLCYIGDFCDLLYTVDKKSNIIICDAKTGKIIKKINFDIVELSYIDIKYIQKINNHLIICNDKNEVMVYDLTKDKFVKIFKNKYFSEVLNPVNLKMSDNNIIIYDSFNMMIVNPTLFNEKKIEAFLLGGLIPKDNLPCSLFDFMNSRRFDRHLLPLIFDYLPKY